MSDYLPEDMAKEHERQRSFMDKLKKDKVFSLNTDPNPYEDILKLIETHKGGNLDD